MNAVEQVTQLVLPRNALRLMVVQSMDGILPLTTIHHFLQSLAHSKMLVWWLRMFMEMMLRISTFTWMAPIPWSKQRLLFMAQRKNSILIISAAPMLMPANKDSSINMRWTFSNGYRILGIVFIILILGRVQEIW